MNAIAEKKSLKDSRVAARYIPSGSEEIKHPDGLGVAYVKPSPVNDSVSVMIFWGTARKHSSFYSYKTREQGMKSIEQAFASMSSHQKLMAERKAEQKAAADKPIKQGDYVSVSQTAKLIRAQLAKKFPGVKFSVVSNSYSGGASIDVRWMDGPTEGKVKEITGAFSGSGFDGMIDLKYSHQSWLLPDGSASFGKSAGTGGSGGSDPGYEYEKPEPDAILVHFGADYVFLHHEHSAAVLEKIAFKVADEYVMQRPEIKTSSDGSAYLDGDLYQRRDDWSNVTLRDMIYRALREQEAQ